MTDYISREDALHFAQNDSEIYIAINCLPAANVVEKSLYNTAMGNVYRFSAMLKVCRNELCLHCGNYKEAHKGACDGCRGKDGVWNG